MALVAPDGQITHRYQQLDSLRGLAALCVFLSHYVLAFKGIELGFVKTSPLGILINGHAAVMFFFVLSGFVLTLPFVDGDRPLAIVGFYIKRIFRIYPAYLLAIAFAIVLKAYLYHHATTTPFSGWLQGFWTWGFNNASYKILGQTFLLIGPTFNNDYIDPVIWSLVVEMKMSILLPFFIILAARNNFVFNIAFLVIILAVTYNHQTGYLGIFYLGILLAKYKDELIGGVKSLNAWSFICLIALALFLYNISFEFFKPYGDRKHLFSYFWRDYTTALGSCLILIIPLSSRRISAFLQSRFCIFLGDISYSFYLLHLPILITICSVVASATLLSAIGIFVSALGLAFALSYLSYRYVEVPFQLLAKRITEKWKFTGNVKL